MTSEPRLEIEKRIVLGVIGEGTVQKQYLDYCANLHSDFRAPDVISGWQRLKADIIARYVAGEGSTKIVKELYQRYDIKITTKTLIAWLRSIGVEIHPPTRERERVAKTKWEKDLWNRIEKLETEAKSDGEQKQIEMKAKDELITLLRSQIADLANENLKLRADVGRLMRVTETLKSTKTGDINEKQSK